MRQSVQKVARMAMLELCELSILSERNASFRLKLESSLAAREFSIRAFSKYRPIIRGAFEAQSRSRRCIARYRYGLESVNRCQRLTAVEVEGICLSCIPNESCGICATCTHDFPQRGKAARGTERFTVRK